MKEKMEKLVMSEGKEILSQGSRIHYLDAMRGILMILGVFLHSAQVFNPEKKWRIYSEQSDQIATYIVNSIHFFRMQEFFIISGYFALLTVRKYGPGLFASVRIKRILIPLFVTALTLNTIQMFLLSQTGWEIYTFPMYITEGAWVSHLWFLIVLAIYFSIVFLSVNFFNHFLKNILNAVIERMLQIPISLVLILLSCVTIFSMAIGHSLSFYVFGIKGTWLFYYTSFFLFGIMLNMNEKLFKEFSTISPLFSIVIIILFLLLYNYFSNYDTPVFKLISIYAKTVSVWFVCALIFYLFRKFLDKPSKKMYLLSDASYSIYLFHQVLVIGFGLLLIRFEIGGLGGLIFLMVLVAIVSLAIHIIFISKIPLLRLLFNGKKDLGP